MEALFLLPFMGIILLSSVSGSESTTFTFRNKCAYKIWPGILTAAGSPQLSSTGFELAAGASFSVTAPPKWSGRFWPRTQCTVAGPTGRFSCASGDCGSGQVACNGAGGVPPVSLVELTLNGYGGADFYDISLVDGFNLPVALTPQTGSCKGTSCPGNVNAACPAELAVRGPGGAVIACKSACLAFKTSEYCCTGNHATSKTCPPTNYSKIFKRQCPQAYTYAYDDASSTFTCPAGANYFVTFCPSNLLY